MLRSFDKKHFSDSLSPASIEELNEPIFNDQEQFISVSIRSMVSVVHMATHLRLRFIYSILLA